jgi:hypothetical protein
VDRGARLARLTRAEIGGECRRDIVAGDIARARMHLLFLGPIKRFPGVAQRESGGSGCSDAAWHALRVIERLSLNLGRELASFQGSDE